MKDHDHKGKGRQLAHFVWLPLLAALLFHYALTAPMMGSADKPLGTSRSDSQTVTYEVTINQDGQVLGSSARKGDSDSANQPPEGSAAEAFLQAVSGDDDDLLVRREPVFESVWSSITTKAAEVKLSRRQANKEHAEELRAGMWANRAQVLNGLKVRGYDAKEERKVKLVQGQPDYTSNIEYIDQDEILPAGCEIVALTVALRSMGYDKAEATKIADEYVEYGGNRKTQYTGSPYEDGLGFPPCIVDAANKWLKDNGGKAHAYNLTGSSFESLCALVELGYPVVIWTTEYMQEPYVQDDLYQPEHCVVMYGLEKEPDKKSDKDEKASKEKTAKESSSSAASKSAESGSSSSASKSSASGSSSAAASKSAGSGSSSAASKSAEGGSSSSASKSFASSSGSVSSSSASSSSSAASSKSATSSDSGASKSSSQESKSAASSGDSSASSSAKKASPYDKVLISDSEVGLVKRDYDDFKRIYEKAGKRALFIQPE